MRLFAVGLSHRTAPVELRESVDFSRGGTADALAALAGRGVSREMVILSTCNRAEIYAVAGPEAPDAMGRFFADYHQMPLARLSEHLYVRRGADAARHLFRVAAGLDSLVVGEPQILGQVKAAYAAASDSGYTAAVTNRLFHYRVRRRQARAQRDRPGRRRGVGQLRRHRPRAQDLRQSQRPARGDPRRRRDGQADRAAPEGPGRPPDHHRQPHAERRGRPGPRARRARRAVGRHARRDRPGRHHHHRHRGGRSGAHQDRPAGGAAAAPAAPAVHHRHRAAARRRGQRRRPRTGLPLQHRRPAGHREGEPGAAVLRAGSGRDDRHRGGGQVHHLAPVARHHPHGRRPARALRRHPPVGARPARAEALRPAARGPRTARRRHPAHRRKAAADADRTAQVGARRLDGGRPTRRR